MKENVVESKMKSPQENYVRGVHAHMNRAIISVDLSSSGTKGTSDKYVGFPY